MRRRRYKTDKMLLLEATDPQRRTVEQIMVDLYCTHGTQAGAAEAMGITRSAFSQWVYRLDVNFPGPTPTNWATTSTQNERE
jgi:hypothetical protein